AEYLGGLLQAVALAAHAVQARARLAQPLLRARAVAFLLLEVPVRAPHDRGTPREREEKEHPCGPEHTQSLGVEDVLHAAPAARPRTAGWRHPPTQRRQHPACASPPSREGRFAGPSTASSATSSARRSPATRPGSRAPRDARRARARRGRGTAAASGSCGSIR